MRVLIVFGTRPEAIKMAPIVHTLQASPHFDVVTCATAQHREMLDHVLAWFGITPDYDLNLMQPDQTLAGLTSRLLTGLDDVIKHVNPTVVLVQGDTTTALIGAMVAFYNQVQVGHVEAGLRTGDIHNPFPEEANRRLVSVLSTHHFAPTETARDALLAEGHDATHITITGNTVIDALKWTVAQPHTLSISLPHNADERLILVTAHRRESFGAEFEQICHALKRIAEAHTDVRLIYPVHLNPNVQEPVYRILGDVERIHLVEPLPYPDFAHMMNRAYFLITDSGGLQEEAPALGKPVLVMRKTTERPEAITAGVAKLVGTDTDAIVREAERLLTDQEAYAAMIAAVSPFGDGHAAEAIRDVLAQML